jgi:DNA-binding PadR family transcriptional regulator
MKPDRHLPLRPVEFQILAGLSGGPRHGYAILQDIEARGEGGAVPGLATLYRAILRLEGGGLIARADGAVGSPDDDSRRTYTLTPLGRNVVAAEASRLVKLVDLVRGSAG